MASTAALRRPTVLVGVCRGTECFELARGAAVTANRFNIQLGLMGRRCLQVSTRGPSHGGVGGARMQKVALLCDQLQKLVVV